MVLNTFGVEFPFGGLYGQRFLHWCFQIWRWFLLAEFGKTNLSICKESGIAWKHPSADLGHEGNRSWVVQAQRCWSLRLPIVGTAYEMFAKPTKINLHYWMPIDMFVYPAIDELILLVLVTLQAAHIAQLAFSECSVLPSARTLPAVLVFSQGHQPERQCPFLFKPQRDHEPWTIIIMIAHWAVQSKTFAVVLTMQFVFNFCSLAAPCQKD